MGVLFLCTLKNFCILRLFFNDFALNFVIIFSDFGFKEESDQCVRDNESEADPDAVPTTCTAGAYYNRTKG